jgi:hypothetical protein
VTVSFANDTASGYEGVTLIEEGRETVLTLQLDYSTPYKLSGLNARRAALKTDLAAVQQRKKNHEIGAGFTIGIGLISGVVAGVLYSQGSVAMDNYLGATGAADAARYREMTEDYSRAFTATAIGSGIFLGIGALSLLSLPDARPLEREIELLDRSIKRLSEGTK